MENNKINKLIEKGKPQTFKVVFNSSDIIILQPMKQQMNKPGKPGIKQKTLREIVLEGFKRQEKFNKQIINRLNNLVKNNNLKE